MISKNRMLEIYDAVTAYQKDKDRSVGRLSGVLQSISPVEFSYLCRCLDRYPYGGRTTTDVIKECPRLIGTLNTEFLCQMLYFPWPARTRELSPAQVVLGIALNHDLLTGDSEEQLRWAMRNYLERSPEIAADEFSRIQETSTKFSESLWDELSIEIRDEIAFFYRRNAMRRRLRELSSNIHRDFRRSTPTARDLAELQQQIDVISQQLATGNHSTRTALLLIELLPSKELEEALPILRPWIETQCPPFIREALLESREIVAGLEVESDERGDKETRSEEGNGESFTKDPKLDELGERLRHREIFDPAIHASLVEDLSAAQFSYLCRAMFTSGSSRFLHLEDHISNQISLFVRGINLPFILRMLDTPWVKPFDGYEQLTLVFKIALSVGLITPAHRTTIADAFARFLNSYPERAAQQFEYLTYFCSVRFATEVWSKIKPNLRAELPLRFRRRLAENLEWSLSYRPGRYPLESLGREIEWMIKSAIESDEVSPDVREIAASLWSSYQNLLERTHLDRAALLGVVYALGSKPDESEKDVALEAGRIPEFVPKFVAYHNLSDSFGLMRRFASPIERASAWVSTAFGRAFSQNPVYVGVSAPIGAKRGSDFIARLYAYVEEFQAQVEDVINSLAPRNKNVGRMRRCRWRIGETVRIHVSGTQVTCEKPLVQFEWNGAFEIADFHFRVSPEPSDEVAIITFNVEVAEINVATIQIEVYLHEKAPPLSVRSVRTEAARTGFASYAVEDRPEVLGRVQSIELSAGMLVFVDCLDLHPGDEWLPILEQEISNRDVFLLFWSMFARESKWVTWEWRTALEKKGANRMEIHPLQAPDEAPPPNELTHINFGDRYSIARKAYSRV